MPPGVEYEIRPYRSPDLPGVSQLMVHLWTPDPEMNREYFTWKYVKNPCSERPVGIVAIHDGCVVGFRGFFATRWCTPDGDTFPLLAPGDTCVDPGHRRGGLSVQMGLRAMEEYVSRYQILLNMSCSPSSVPGYLKMGFKPLVSRECLTRATTLGLAAAFVPGRGPLHMRSRVLGLRSKGRARLHGDEVIVGCQPDPGGMARVAATEVHGNRLALVRDQGFLSWRYGSGRRYLFYTLRDGREMKSYLALRLARDFRAQVVDHGGSDDDVVSLLGHLVAGGRFEYLSIWAFSVGESLRARMMSMGFRQDGLSRFLEARIAGERALPLLVRPTRIDSREDDWRVGGLRIDRIDSWSIRGIASDSN